MDSLLPIGELARRTGLSVKTIRAWSDAGLVPPEARTPAGYRRYGAEAAARLELIGTLRELGLDRAAIRAVLARESSPAEAAAVHAEALEVEIRALRRRQAVLTIAARRGSDATELALLHRLAVLSVEEQDHLVGDFVKAVFGEGLRAPWTAGVVRSLTPELPADADRERIEAWIEWAELARDPEFRALLRTMAEEYEAGRAADGPPRPDPVARVRTVVAPALAAGLAPGDPGAAPVVAAVLACGEAGALLARLEGVNDPRRDRHQELLARINGWPPPEPLAPVVAWAIEALRQSASVRK